MIKKLEKRVNYLLEHLKDIKKWEAWSESEPMDDVYCIYHKNEKGKELELNLIEIRKDCFKFDMSLSKNDFTISGYIEKEEFPNLYEKIFDLYCYVYNNTKKSVLKVDYLKDYIQQLSDYYDEEYKK